MTESIVKIPGGKKLIDTKQLLEKIGLEEKMRVADLGCGRRGYFSLQAAKIVGNKGLVIAVDVGDVLVPVVGGDGVEADLQLFVVGGEDGKSLTAEGVERDEAGLWRGQVLRRLASGEGELSVLA